MDVRLFGFAQQRQELRKRGSYRLRKAAHIVKSCHKNGEYGCNKKELVHHTPILISCEIIK
jgi:hypothetical protein